MPCVSSTGGRPNEGLYESAEIAEIDPTGQHPNPLRDAVQLCPIAGARHLLPPTSFSALLTSDSIAVVAPSRRTGLESGRATVGFLESLHSSEYS